MESTSVTSKGQVTIPKEIRQKLGIRAGSRVEFVVIDDHAEMRISHRAPEVVSSGFGMLKSRRPSVPATLDPATLIKK